MSSTPPNNRDLHAAIRGRSYHILDNARRSAAKTAKYDSNLTRGQLKDNFRARFGADPYDWQLDVSEAILLKLDSIAHAGTGAGKTMPFVMPLFLDRGKKVIVISPLNILQTDQANRFQKLDVPSVAVNGDTWTKKLQQELTDGKYQGILVGPEMCLEHEGFRAYLTGNKFKDISAIIIDEAHCISQWGGDFRKVYSQLAKLRAFFPPHVPIHATSATFTDKTLQEVRSSLGIDTASSFYINLGNDRPNIAFSVRPIKSERDYKTLVPLLSKTSTPTHPDDLYQQIIFVNKVRTSQKVARDIAALLPKALRRSVGYLHSRRSRRMKTRVMQRFREGKIKILVATEAAGMGADIPNIEQVIQLGVPSSLTVWMQRAGRAGRSPEINARAILLVEKSMFEQQKKRQKQAKDSGEAELGGDGADDNDDGDDDVEHRVDGEEEIRNMVYEEGDDTRLRPGNEWKKRVDPALREWIETKGCRRDAADKHFSNPPRTKAPTGQCCDNCDSSRPTTPENPVSEPPSLHSTPSKSTNENGKRPMTEVQTSELEEALGPKTRRLEHLASAQHALDTWRTNTFANDWCPPPFTIDVFLPNSVVKTLASKRFTSTTDFEENVGNNWAFAKLYANSILSVLKAIDNRYEKEKETRAEEKKAATQAKRAAEAQQAAERREEARRQKERDQELRRVEREEARRQKERNQELRRVEKENQRQEKAAAAAMKPPRKRSKKVAIEGSSRMTFVAPAMLATPLSASPASSPFALRLPLTPVTPAPRVAFQPILTPFTATFATPQPRNPPALPQPSPSSPSSASKTQPRPRPRPKPRRVPAPPLASTSSSLLPPPPPPQSPSRPPTPPFSISQMSVHPPTSPTLPSYVP